MKKVFRIIGRFFRLIGSFFDKWLITPITKFILVIMNFLNDNTKNFDRIISKKSTLLVISLILAFITFWVVEQESNVMIDQYAEILYNRPVSAIYNEELYVVEGLPKTVDITLVGERRHIFLAKQSPSKDVSVDLTGLKPGNHSVTLKYSQKLKSLDYKLDPSNVTVTIYEKESETRSLTYDVLHRDSLDKKLYISDIELDRTNVIVKGAKYMLDKVATVKALVDVDNIPHPKAGEITLKDIPLVAYDQDGQILDVEIVPKNVSAKLTITSPSKEIPIKVVPKGNLAFGKSINSIKTSVTSVTVYGKQSAVDKLDSFDIEIDVTGLEKNKEFHINLTKPAGITEISSKTVTVNVEIDDSISKEFKNIPVRIENLNPKFKASAISEDDSEVTVVVKGSSHIVKDVEGSSLKPFIDLDGYDKPGTYEVPVKVTGDDLRLSYSSKTKKVKVVIIEK